MSMISLYFSMVFIPGRRLNLCEYTEWSEWSFCDCASHQPLQTRTRVCDCGSDYDYDPICEDAQYEARGDIEEGFSRWRNQIQDIRECFGNCAATTTDDPIDSVTFEVFVHPDNEIKTTVKTRLKTKPQRTRKPVSATPKNPDTIAMTPKPTITPLEPKTNHPKTDQPRIIEVIVTENSDSERDSDRNSDRNSERDSNRDFNRDSDSDSSRTSSHGSKHGKTKSTVPMHVPINKCETPSCSCQQICKLNTTTNHCGCDCFDGFKLDCYGMCSPKPKTKIIAYDKTTKCPRNWLQVDGECFFIGKEYVTYIEAASICASMEARLVQMKSRRQNYFLSAIFDRDLSDNEFDFFWVSPESPFSMHESDKASPQDYGDNLRNKCMVSNWNYVADWHILPCAGLNSNYDYYARFACELPENRQMFRKRRHKSKYGWERYG